MPGMERALSGEAAEDDEGARMYVHTYMQVPCMHVCTLCTSTHTCMCIS